MHFTLACYNLLVSFMIRADILWPQKSEKKSGNNSTLHTRHIITQTLRCLTHNTPLLTAFLSLWEKNWYGFTNKTIIRGWQFPPRWEGNTPPKLEVFNVVSFLLLRYTSVSIWIMGSSLCLFSWLLILQFVETTNEAFDGVLMAY